MRVLQVRRRAPTRSALAVLLGWTVCWFIVRAAFTLVYRLRCRGAGHIPPSGPLIYACNHQSHLDPPAVGSLVWDRPFASMAKSGLFRFRPFAWLIRSLGAIPLELGAGDVAAVRAAIRELRGGGCVLLFPEGGRSLHGAVGLFKPGLLSLVKRTGAPLVPVAIEGAFDIWPKGRRLPRLRGRLMVAAGPPIPAAELLQVAPDEALDRLRRLIDAMRLELRRTLRARSRGRYPAPGPGDRGCGEEGPPPPGADRATLPADFQPGKGTP